MAHVGSVAISCSDARALEFVSRPLLNWLRANNWDRMVTVEGHFTQEPSEIAIHFVPGEYQSNSEKRMFFRETPEWEKIKKELAAWLYEVE